MKSSNLKHIYSPKTISQQLFKLTDIVTEIINLKSNKANINLLISRLTKLEDFIMEHFLREEELMVKYSFSGLELHKQQHNYLRGKLEEFNLYNFTSPKEYYEESLRFMIDLLSIHMIQEDMKLGNIFA